MSDDIVTRLRERAKWCYHGIDPNGAYQPHPRPESCERCDEFRQTADEIERLRKLTSELAQLMMPFAFLMTSEEQEKVMKAVRGE